MTTEQDHAKDYRFQTSGDSPKRLTHQRLFRVFERDSRLMAQTSDQGVVIQLGLEAASAPKGLDVLVRRDDLLPILARIEAIESWKVENKHDKLAITWGDRGRFVVPVVRSEAPAEFQWLEVPASERRFVTEIDSSDALRHVRWALRSIDYSDPPVLVVDGQGVGTLPVTRWHAATQEMTGWPPIIWSRRNLEWLLLMLGGPGSALRIYRLPSDGGGDRYAFRRKNTPSLLMLRNGSLDDRLVLHGGSSLQGAVDLQVPVEPFLRMIHAARIIGAGEVEAELSIGGDGGKLHLSVQDNGHTATDELGIVLSAGTANIVPWQWNVRQLQLAFASMQPLKQAFRLRVDLDNQLSQLSSGIIDGSVGRQGEVAIDQLVSVRVEKWVALQERESAVGRTKQDCELRSDGKVANLGPAVPLASPTSAISRSLWKQLLDKFIVDRTSWEELPPRVRAKFRVSNALNFGGGAFMMIEAGHG